MVWVTLVVVDAERLAGYLEFRTSEVLFLFVSIASRVMCFVAAATASPMYSKVSTRFEAMPIRSISDVPFQAKLESQEKVVSSDERG